MALDVERARSCFPALQSDVVYFENAVRSMVAAPVVDRLKEFMEGHAVQPDWPNMLAARSREHVETGVAAAAWLASAEMDEVVLSHSTTINVYVLANALRPTMKQGDAIVVTNQDHEANSGAWRRLEQTGIEIREWRVTDSGDLDPADLSPLLDERVQLSFQPLQGLWATCGTDDHQA